MSVELVGQVIRVTYADEESGFAVVQIETEDSAEAITAVGSMIGPKSGQMIQLKGEWTQHQKYGRQFSVVESQTRVPVTSDGIARYLSSGLISGIGSEIAARIVARFGEGTLRVIDQSPERLTEIEGIGAKRAQSIREAWDEQHGVRDIVVFLQSCGIGMGLAAKVYKRYGNHAVRIIQENPYCLAADVFGIGFKTADSVARELGLDMASEARAEAALAYILSQWAAEGHTCCPSILLLQKGQQMLQIDRSIVTKALDNLRRDAAVVEVGGSTERDALVCLPAYHVSEVGIAQSIAALSGGARSLPSIDTPRALDWVQERLGIVLAGAQARAVASAFSEKLLVITGGPGTGKTTITKVILTVLERARAKVLLTAPTGRAAKRLADATGHEAKTIHRLLEYNQRQGGFQRDKRQPLGCDLLIVDEASMVDSVLMYHLLQAHPFNASLVLIGDANQLPSVGAGNVLDDIIASRRAPVVELNEVFRQAKESQIIVNAHRIHLGLEPFLDPPGDETDFYFVEREEPQAVASTIVDLVTGRIPRRFRLDPVQGIQVLTPMRRGVAGVANLNSLLQDKLNAGGDHIARGAKILKAGDKVMQIRNNYDKDVYNGDIGTVGKLDIAEKRVIVSFDNRPIVYEHRELDELELAYAVSVHKAQGCEFPAVVMPLITQHYILLQRNLLYTAVTRGKRLVVIVGSRKAMQMALKNNAPQRRYTQLKELLMMERHP